MRNVLKNIYKKSPLFLRKILLRVREFYFSSLSYRQEIKNYPTILSYTPYQKKINNILIYHISGMYYAGTEKILQTIANELAEDNNVFFMYSRDNFSQNQKNLLDARITCIEFSYSHVEKTFPYFIYGMTPHIKDVLAAEDIDILVTASTGHSQYPFNTIKNIPIVLVNIFGSPTLQRNITSTIFISQAVQQYSEQYTGPKKTNIWAHASVNPSTKNTTLIQETVRRRLNIPLTAFVFGRIGRPSDDIYDPIGIEAFKEIVTRHPETYYLIMSPPPALIQKVIDEAIPHVIYMSNKEDIWDFYYTIDALAHFRLDGESFGLNIAEAMYAGKPVISHKSHIWNAHLEYLEPSFSRVTEQGDTRKYITYMQEFINLQSQNLKVWETIGKSAQEASLRYFSKEVYGNKIKSIIQSL